MAEAPRSSVNNSEQDLKKLDLWNKWNPNSKLNEISDFIKQSDNSNIKQLMEYIVNQDYRWLQKAVWYKGMIDGKLWTNSLESVKEYAKNAEIEDVKKEKEKETKNELENQKQEADELMKNIVIANEGKDKLSLKEEDWKIKIDKRTISFEWLFLQDGNWNEKRIEKINNFYVKRIKDWLEVYSNGEPLPRFKLNNDWTVEWRSNSNDSKFDIKLNWRWTIFEFLKVELTNNYDKYKTPEKKMDFTWKGFSIEQWGKKFSVNTGNIYISWLKLYNSQTKKWESVQNITNMYVKRDNENNLTIYSSGEDKPKMLLKSNGIVKWVLPSNWDNLNYWAKEDTALWRTIWGELNSKYNTYRHEDVASTSEPVLITYTTKEEPKRVNVPLSFERNANGEYVSEQIIAGETLNNSKQPASKEYISNNIEWRDISLDFKKVPILDEYAVRTVQDSVAHKITDLHISKIWKEWKKLYINGNIFLEPSNNWWLLFAQDIDWIYKRFEITHLMYGYKWKNLYNKLNRDYFS